MVASSPVSPSLDIFVRAAEGDGDVYVALSGTPPRILKTGNSITAGNPGTAQISPDIDTTTMFIDTLSGMYGNGIGKAVSRELALSASPGRPLSARKIAQAISMAETALQALSGVDFATRMACLTTSGAPIFSKVCDAMGIDPASLDASQQAFINQAMYERFDDAAQRGESPVTNSTAEAWLGALIAEYRV